MRVDIPQQLFDEMKLISIDIWKTYDDTHWYASQKIRIINSTENIQDNGFWFRRMFDWYNQLKFLDKCSNELKKFLGIYYRFPNPERYK